MINTLKNSFTQAALGSTIWITMLATLQFHQRIVPFHFIWNILLIGLLMGLVFGVIYPYLWHYSTFKALTNIIISTCANNICMFIGLTLYSRDMLNIVMPYWIGIILLTLIGHIIGFYFYSKYKNSQLTKELNRLI
ncbi:hypothetical protein ACWOAH_06380 [Vagococcus vulneris]|uniref:DUF3021 domain-containing protein n=1 Tax=Vagococcus vulneris TaxID=1977869 RepID=A0A429ZYR4_9ENTE|nr:hypothetical protein [Vagococcus vulneris]RST99127.1 hypothetical protein CBF37_05525 [Vagococcus vulneris]